VNNSGHFLNWQPEPQAGGKDALKNYLSAIKKDLFKQENYSNLAAFILQKNFSLEIIKKQIRNTEPSLENVYFYNMLGVALGNAGKPGEAIAYYEYAIKLDPGYANSYNNLGVTYHLLENFDRALEYYFRSLETEPANANTFANIAIIYKLQGKPEDALAYYLKASEAEPGNPYFYTKLGVLFQEKNDFEQARQYYERVLELAAGNAEVYTGLGFISYKGGNLPEARNYYAKAAALARENPEIYNNLGLLELSEKNYPEAEKLFQKALKLNAKNPEFYNNIGVALAKQKIFAAAIDNYFKAAELNPEYATAFNNLGLAYYDQEKLEQAARFFLKAINLSPADSVFYANLGKTYVQTGSYAEARGVFQKAVELNPENAEAHFELSLLLLLAGNLKAGFAEYEWRMKLKTVEKRSDQPLWDGSELNGKRLFIHSEQGLGDNIQFYRYLPLLKAKNGHIIYERPQKLAELLKDTEGIDTFITFPEKVPEHDRHIPLLSLAKVFNTEIATIPGEVPYINVEENLKRKWQEKMPDGSLKAGIVWEPRPDSETFQKRRCPLNYFLPLAGIPGIQIYSLQKGASENLPVNTNIINLSDEISTFADTAAIISNLDLVISVDTAAAHLAGALGKPVWLLLPFSPDWRWLLDREDSPWYPTMKIFRQTARGNWDSVFEKLLPQLELFL
jgi:Flp pilus assembly protein TadD